MAANVQTFLATTGSGMVRADRNSNGNWQVETRLEDMAVTCLASDPANPNAVYYYSRTYDGKMKAHEKKRKK